MKLDEAKLQEVVEKIAYQQFGEEQIDDLYAKMGILNDYVQEQLRLFTVLEQSEQLTPFINALTADIVTLGAAYEEYAQAHYENIKVVFKNSLSEDAAIYWASRLAVLGSPKTVQLAYDTTDPKSDIYIRLINEV